MNNFIGKVQLAVSFQLLLVLLSGHFGVIFPEAPHAKIGSLLFHMQSLGMRPFH